MEILTELCWISRLSWKNWNLNNIESFTHEQEISIHLFKCSLITLKCSITDIVYLFSSVQFSRSAMSNSLGPHGPQHARLPCPSPTPRTYSKPMSIESVMPSNHLILCRPLFLPPSIFPIIRVFSDQSVLCIRWPKYWSFSFSISPSNEYSGLIPLGWTGWISLLSKGLSRIFSNITVQKHQFFGTQLSL